MSIQNNTPSNMLKAALYYKNKFGFSVIPIAPGKKSPPLVEWEEFQNRKATDEEITEWWTKTPDANIAIITGKISNLAVVDFDKYDPKYSEDTALEYFPDTILTPSVATPGGGTHLYFQSPHEGLRNNARALPGIDLRAEGGYVVAPPSVNGNGKRYEWLVRPDGTFEDVPDGYISYINKKAFYIYRGGENANEQVVTSVTSCDKMFNKGTRDQDLFHTANCLVKGGMQQENVRQILEILANNCNPPFPISEAEIKIKSALERSARRERNLQAEVDSYISVTSGYFSVTDCYSVLQVVTKEDKAAVRTALSRRKGKTIEKYGKKDGVYQRIDTELEMIDFSEDEGVRSDVLLPLDLHEMVDVCEGNIVLVAGGFNSGKGHPDGTLLMTSTGWEKIENINVGDVLYSEKGEPVAVEGIFPRGRQHCYKFTFNDGANIEVDEDHIWSIMTRYNKTQTKTGHNNKNVNFGKFTQLTTKEIVDRCGTGEIVNYKKFALPQMLPIQYPAKSLPLDPYLLGLLLGDGGFTHSSIVISSKDEEILDAFRTGGFELSHSDKHDYRILGMVGIIRELGLHGLKSNNKYVPHDYLFNSVENRIAVLAGLLDTDGYISSDRVAIEFASVSEELANNVMFLVKSLGGRAIISEKVSTFTYNNKKHYGQKVYRLAIKINNLCPFRLKRKREKYRVGAKRDVKIIRRIDYAGIKKTTCIKVSNKTGLYIAQDFIVTHNTSFALNVLQMNKNRMRIRYLSSEMKGGEFKRRWRTFGLPNDFWLPDEMTEYVALKNNLAGSILPDGLNIVDYLEFPDGDFTQGAEYMKQVHDKLTTGVAVVCIQQKENAKLPRSGDLVMEKPRLAISFKKIPTDTEDVRGVVEIQKAKNVRLGKCDGKKLEFQLTHQGSHFKVIRPWGWWKDYG